MHILNCYISGPQWTMCPGIQVLVESFPTLTLNSATWPALVKGISANMTPWRLYKHPFTRTSPPSCEEAQMKEHKEREDQSSQLFQLRHQTHEEGHMRSSYPQSSCQPTAATWVSSGEAKEKLCRQIRVAFIHKSRDLCSNWQLIQHILGIINSIHSTCIEHLECRVLKERLAC